jgi:fumarate hydratase class II
MTDASEPAPKILDLPIGLDATGMRREFDSLGDVEVPANRYWGAQTQRSLEHFNIGNDRMPKEVYHAYGYVKKAAAAVSTAAGRLPAWKGRLIERVCDEVISGQLDTEFPLCVWQTGSGTQSNMNVNEVISNRCIQLVGGTLGSQEPVHPSDHVNMGHSSNDTFPTAMHIAAYTMATGKTIPALKRLRDAIDAKSRPRTCCAGPPGPRRPAPLRGRRSTGPDNERQETGHCPGSLARRDTCRRWAEARADKGSGGSRRQRLALAVGV